MNTMVPASENAGIREITHFPIAVDVEGAAGLTSLTKDDIRRAINEGTLVAHKAGKRLVILPDDLRAWVRALPAA